MKKRKKIMALMVCLRAAMKLLLWIIERERGLDRKAFEAMLIRLCKDYAVALYILEKTKPKNPPQKLGWEDFRKKWGR